MNKVQRLIHENIISQPIILYIKMSEREVHSERPLRAGVTAYLLKVKAITKSSKWPHVWDHICASHVQ